VETRAGDELVAWLEGRFARGRFAYRLGTPEEIAAYDRWAEAR
jgi:hypothetical protein